MLTVFGSYLVKHRDEQLLQCCGRGVVDDSIFAGLQDEADVERCDKQVAFNIGGIVLQKRR